MNTAIDHLAVSLFNKSLNECSSEELQQLTHQYPWFAPAQLLYAKKLQATSISTFEDQLQKTSLYFQNRLWLQHLLDDTGTDNRSGLPAEERPAQPVVAEETATAISIAPAITEIAAPPPATYEPETAVTQMPDTAEADEPKTEPEAPASAAGDAPDLPSIKLPDLNAEPAAPNASLTFEPYHTVDYFASQGIKFKEEEHPGDRFGHQLKSFTEWLKTLKRLPASEIVTGTDPASEKKVEQLAEHSLAERYVVTEAMAEVWIKQGNKAKAEEIYRKLSLLEPLKSAYFAAKIEDLKKTS